MIKDMAEAEVIMERVTDKKAVVTGAARGLGKEIGVNLTGTFYCTRAVLKKMIERCSDKAYRY